MIFVSLLILGCFVSVFVAETITVPGPNPQLGYYELDYTYLHRGNTTTLTGVRTADGNSSEVLLSGFTWVNFEYTNGLKSNYGSFIYRGPLQGGGTWFGNFVYPSSINNTVLGTFFYGPCNANASGLTNIRDADNFFQAVGDYSTLEGGAMQFGLLFQGYFNGTGVWKTLDPSVLLTSPEQTLFGTIAHSTMGGLVVGNYNTAQETYHSMSFVYDIADDVYTPLLYTSSAGVPDFSYGITAYCIYHYQGTDLYSIAGGITKLGYEDGFIVDWNATSRTAHNWRMFHHVNSTITHFQGMWPNFVNPGRFLFYFGSPHFPHYFYSYSYLLICV
jgi:hypothetical protein